MFAGGSCLKLCLSKLESFRDWFKWPGSNWQTLSFNFPRIYFAESVKFNQTPQDVGANLFFLLFFLFSLTCYRVFFYFSLSDILLITLLCYVLYVNFVIVCYLAPIYYQFLRVFSVTAFVEVDYLFPRWPWPPTLLSSAFGKQLRFSSFFH